MTGVWFPVGAAILFDTTSRKFWASGCKSGMTYEGEPKRVLSIAEVRYLFISISTPPTVLHDPSHPPFAEFQNAWSFTFTSLHVFIVWCLGTAATLHYVYVIRSRWIVSSCKEQPTDSRMGPRTALNVMENRKIVSQLTT
jgi:hypothetical protein